MTDLPAGPEIDRLVAERVMGWTFRMIDEGRDGRFYKWDGRPENCWYRSPECGWRPSTDITHAWEVVERQRALGRFLRLDSVPDGWWAGFSVNHLTLADTASLAICRAALAAAPSSG